MYCELCGTKLETCVFATYKKDINGRSYVFCCVRCADNFENKMKKQKKSRQK